MKYNSQYKTMKRQIKSLFKQAEEDNVALELLQAIVVHIHTADYLIKQEYRKADDNLDTVLDYTFQNQALIREEEKRNSNDTREKSAK